tara:strand:+ start:413 stop:1312 length:900 start_codon:yes stop_codon:yes gene_type:complete
MEDLLQRKKLLLRNVKPEIATYLEPYIASDFCGKIPAAIKYDLQSKFNLDDKNVMLELLPIAANFSVAPVSQFHVGAIVLDQGDNLYMGANLEIRNEALFHSVHAEQTAISHAWQDGATGIKAITTNISPCGHCRQFLLELDLYDNLMVHVAQKPSRLLHDLIHDPFNAKSLDVEHSLFNTQKQQLSVPLAQHDAFINETLKHVNLSYAPYSGNYAAIGLQTVCGQEFFGRYAENAAFNPSLLPMQCALAFYARSGFKIDAIERVVLIESNSGKISLRNASVNALSAVSKIKLEHHIAQ